jgi:hypothetical protein
MVQRKSRNPHPIVINLRVSILGSPVFLPRGCEVKRDRSAHFSSHGSPRETQGS